MNNEFMNITSITYNENDLNMKYFIDVNDIWWYSYEDIIDYLEFDINVANSVYKHKILENVKQECLDDNNEHGIHIRKRFITSDAVRALIKRVNERTNNLIKAMNNLELAVNAHDVYEDADELKCRINKLKEGIENDDYEVIFYQAYEISNSKSGREVLDKNNVIDKDVEELLDLVRTDIVYYDIDEIEELELNLIKKRETDESVTVNFKRNKKDKKESTAPSWLRDIFK